MSAILSADDLNDFISPGVACIKPVETLPPVSGQLQSNNENEFEVVIDGQQSTPTAGAPAEISLTDCLACSGCVTSAEAVLVSLQSHNELLNVLDQAPALKIQRDDTDGTVTVEGLENPDSKLFVASVSPQTRASLAAAAGQGVNKRDAGRMITQLLAGPSGLQAGGKWNNGFTWVADTNAAREACLVLGAEEATSDNMVAKPILSSSCPGWVCYAEKTHPYVLPHISKIKSPQALMGTLLKTSLSRTLGISPDRIWHLAVMPCFDKKLEASREELTDSVWNGNGQPGRGVRDVDCVITSKEILMLTESRGIDFFGLPKELMPISTRVPFPDATLEEFIFPSKSRTGRLTPAAGTSGGNLYYTLQYVASRHPGSRIETTRGRNVDVAEFSVMSGSGETVFKAARYYGFRNIQNLVRKLKPIRPSRMPGARSVGVARKAAGKSTGPEYDYVEVMACPGGCTNGGGQIKVDDPLIIERRGSGPQPGPQEQKQWLAEVDEAYFSADESEPEDGGDIERTGSRGGIASDISPVYIRNHLAHWSAVTGIDIDRLVSTSYREVVSDIGKSKPNDTERVVLLASKMGGGW
ncbi:iron only hydrogenase large subunit domain-containing protein [Nemania sp. FL0916]|nr:iron only hydrogenase large subunit domain-containing protein [Nemania sp. FL0916]